MSERRIFYFPIIHSQSEMGNLGQSILKATQKKLGRRGWRRKLDLVGQFWSSVEKIVLHDLALPYAKTRVYQDGLPICDKEAEIVEDIAKKGSPNHQLLLRLKEKGATIMGTESADLLIQEYQLAKKLLGAKNPQESLRLKAEQKETSDVLLEKRDAFIAERIGQTLQAGETGLLFLGMLHNPVARLPPDIQVLFPLGNLLNDRISGLNTP